MKYLGVTPKSNAARRLVERYENITFACSYCESENTVETDIPCPSGTYYQVMCENGHLTNGMPPENSSQVTLELWVIPE